MTQPIKLPAPGEYLAVGNRIYTTCVGCGKLIQVNKPLIGGLHIC